MDEQDGHSRRLHVKTVDGVGQILSIYMLNCSMAIERSELVSTRMWDKNSASLRRTIVVASLVTHRLLKEAARKPLTYWGINWILHKSVRHGSLTLHFEPFLFWLRIRNRKTTL